MSPKGPYHPIATGSTVDSRARSPARATPVAVIPAAGLAGRDEILITSDVARRVRGKVRVSYSRSTEIGGKEFELYKVR